MRQGGFKSLRLFKRLYCAVFDIIGLYVIDYMLNSIIRIFKLHLS